MASVGLGVGEIAGALGGGKDCLIDQGRVRRGGTVVVDEEEGLVMSVVKVRDADRSTERAAFLEAAVAVAGMTTDVVVYGVFVEVLVGVERLIA